MLTVFLYISQVLDFMYKLRSFTYKLKRLGVCSLILLLNPIGLRQGRMGDCVGNAKGRKKKKTKQNIKCRWCQGNQLPAPTSRLSLRLTQPVSKEWLPCRDITPSTTSFYCWPWCTWHGISIWPVSCTLPAYSLKCEKRKPWCCWCCASSAQP